MNSSDEETRLGPKRKRWKDVWWVQDVGEKKESNCCLAALTISLFPLTLYIIYAK